MLGGVPPGLTPKTAPPDAKRFRVAATPATALPMDDVNREVEQQYEARNESESPPFVERLREATSPGVPLKLARELLREETLRTKVRADALAVAERALQQATAFKDVLEASEREEAALVATLKERIDTRAEELRTLYANEMVREAELRTRGSELEKIDEKLERDMAEMQREVAASEARLRSLWAEADELAIDLAAPSPAQ